MSSSITHATSIHADIDAFNANRTRWVAWSTVARWLSYALSLVALFAAAPVSSLALAVIFTLISASLAASSLIALLVAQTRNLATLMSVEFTILLVIVGSMIF